MTIIIGASSKPEILSTDFSTCSINVIAGFDFDGDVTTTIVMSIICTVKDYGIDIDSFQTKILLEHYSKQVTVLQREVNEEMISDEIQ